MRVSQLIEELESLKKEHGDVNVGYDSDRNGYWVVDKVFLINKEQVKKFNIKPSDDIKEFIGIK